MTVGSALGGCRSLYFLSAAGGMSSHPITGIPAIIPPALTLLSCLGQATAPILSPQLTGPSQQALSHP